MRRFNLYHYFGALIGRYPIQILLTNFIVCCALSSYFIFYPLIIDTDIRRGFAHKHGRSAMEFQYFGNFHNISIRNLELIILLFIPRGNAKSMKMDSKLLNEIERADKFLRNLSLPLPFNNNKLLKLQDIQTARGNVNFLFNTYKWGLEMQEENLYGNRSALDENIELNFPKSHIYGHNFPLQAHFFDVKLYNDSKISIF